MVSLVAELNADLAELDPPPEFREDHDRVVVHFEKIGAALSEVASAALAGDKEPARRIAIAVIAIFCETTGSLSSEEFKALVAVHFGVAPPPEECG